MRRLVALTAVLAFAGCSAFGDDLESVDGVLLVSLGQGPDDGTDLWLATEDDYPCGARLVVSTGQTDGGVHVDVEGVEYPDGTGCLAVDGPISAFADLPVPSPTVDVEVSHRGATDLYRYACGFAGCDLSAVRTSTTRLGTP
jgi:hypothetical protein